MLGKLPVPGRPTILDDSRARAFCACSMCRWGLLDLGGGRVVRWCWVNFQCRGVLLIWIIVGQGPTVLAVGAGGGCLDIFSLVYHSSFLSPSLWETARYRLKYCLKGPLSPKQPTNQLLDLLRWLFWLQRPFETIFKAISGRIPNISVYIGPSPREKEEKG